MQIIARVRTDFPTKFGVPRQSGLAPSLQGHIVFEPPYRTPDAVRGLEGFTHLWLIWGFSEIHPTGWSATVRPPRLGGNARVGVFATRSPFRPNPIGLSSVRLERVALDPAFGPVLHVSGIDMVDRTPVYDIKPYLPYTDSHPDASSGFAEAAAHHRLTVDFPAPLLALVPGEARGALLDVLAQDPRPSYQNDPDRRYGVPFMGVDVRFTVCGDTLTVREVVPYPPAAPSQPLRQR